MRIRFQRAFSPESMTEAPCGLCERSFKAESVMAVLDGPGDEDLGEACPECITMLGQHYPERFPTLEEYEEAKRRYPKPLFATDEEAERAEDEVISDGATVATSWIDRSELTTEEVVRAVMDRGDTFNDAFAAISGSVEWWPARRRMLALLREERDRAWAAFRRYKEARQIRR
jgi:hypothetical protein